MPRNSDLNLLDPDFKKLLDVLLVTLAPKTTNVKGYTLKVFESHRSPERQNELFAKGRDPNAVDFGRTVTKAKAFQSAHQFGLAVDLVFQDDKGNWSWDDKKLPYNLIAPEAKKCGLQTLSFEMPHVEMKGFDWKKLKAGPLDTIEWEKWLRNGRK